MRIANLLRRELLKNHGCWKFSGSFTENVYQTPMLKVFFRQLLYGPYSRNRGGKRDTEIEKMVDVLIQIMLSNVKTDRQRRYTPKTDRGFRKTVQTPLSLGLSMYIHRKARSKIFIDDVADMSIGAPYNVTINTEKLIESAITGRMKISGGYCLPSFIKKNQRPFFAIDNIDFSEDTAYGQNTLHGTVIVINQVKNDLAEPLFCPLKIPDKLERLRIDVSYHEEPIIKS